MRHEMKENSSSSSDLDGGREGASDAVSCVPMRFASVKIKLGSQNETF